MKTITVILFALSTAGCISGPRPFDGALGYKTDPSPNGIQVTYIDEAKIKREKTLKLISTVCADTLKADISHINLSVDSESSIYKTVNMSVAIPVGSQSTGSFGSKSPGSPVVAIQHTSIQNEGVMREIKLKKIVASCSIIKPGKS